MMHSHSVIDIREDESADRSAELEGTTTALLILATVFVGLRFYARYLHGAKYGMDDWMIVGALVTTFMAGALNYGMIAHGLGRHASTLSQDDLIAFFKLLLAFECIYVTAVMMVKLSVLAMYSRIFPTKSFRIGGGIIAFTVVAWWIAIWAVCIWQCDPIKKAWLPWLEYGTCINLKASFIGNAIPNILTDVAILAMPVGQVWRLQVSLAQKASLCFMFLLGSFVLFASIYRFTTIMQFDTADTTWTLATACTWCVVEAACGVISSCLPTLRPIMVKFSTQFGSIAGSKSHPSDNENSRSGYIRSLGQGRSHGRGGSKNPHTDLGLVTIGGTNDQRRGFERLGHEHEDAKYGIQMTIRSDGRGSPRHSSDHVPGGKEGGTNRVVGGTNSESDTNSADDFPLKDGIRVQREVRTDEEWGARGERTGPYGSGHIHSVNAQTERDAF
ncbi:hypothetical protein MKZ38_007133 [Zalerion maritima]|uniref:Rhodopsin domain-containing protein n=1 Tax=Zalerion maritima TaxID=339359 RepID=A0AAD5WW08_9PEZI|nr:hypothetical protein MKZ38_007133 [Zalerion maritima]